MFMPDQIRVVLYIINQVVNVWLINVNKIFFEILIKSFRKNCECKNEYILDSHFEIVKIVYFIFVDISFFDCDVK